MLKIKRALPLLILSLLIATLVSVPATRAQEEEIPPEMMGLLSSFMSLNVQVQTGSINLMTETASIYIVTTSGGAPVEVANMSVVLWFDSPDNWTETEPEIRGGWEIRNYTDVDRGCGTIWHAPPLQNPETGETYASGLYVATYDVGGFEAGDYLVWVYAEAPFNMTAMMGDIGTDMGDQSTRGVGTCGFTVSEDMTVGLLTAKAMPEALESMGTSIGEYLQLMGANMQSAMAGMETVMHTMMANADELTGSLTDMLAFQEKMGELINKMTGNMENIMGFMDDMLAFQEEMGVNVEDMIAYQEEMKGKFEEFKTSLKEFRESVEASKTIIDDLQGTVATVKADVGETVAALPLIYKEAQEIQKVTAAGVPIAQILSAITTILSLIAIVLLVKLVRQRAPVHKKVS